MFGGKLNMQTKNLLFNKIGKAFFKKKWKHFIKYEPEFFKKIVFLISVLSDNGRLVENMKTKK